MGGDPLQRRFRRAGIMFQLELVDAVIRPDQPAKTGDGTSLRTFGQCHLRRDIDRIDRNPNADHPPVTGGKIATSRAPASNASRPTKFWSIAARNLSGAAIASA
ncbi:Uncharacterised protein [Sphingomonas paucimobilis]|nr:Uncharacterised protein [Sphingomonas paucimobilis]